MDPYDMSDEALEEAFRAARAELDEEDTAVDEDAAIDEDTSHEDIPDVEDTEEPTEEDTATEEGEEEDGVDPEGDENAETSDEEADSSPAEKAPEATESSSKLRKFKASGKEYEISEEEIFEKFPKVFAQAMDYTKKMQYIAPWRKSIDALEGAKLNHDDINLMIDVFKGSKEAISEVIKRTGVDVLELGTEESTYVANDYGRDGSIIEVQEVLDSIKGDEEYTTTLEIISKGWDDTSWGELSRDPEKIRLLHTDVKSGLYAKLVPAMEKEKIFDGGKQPDIAYYIAAGRKYFAQQRKEQLAETIRNTTASDQSRIAAVKEQEAKRQSAQQQAAKRKAAAPTTTSSTARGGVTNYLEAADEEYEEWYRKLENSN